MRGRLFPLHRGVYALGHTALPSFSGETAAVLACGDRAVLSHAAAARLWGFGDGSAADVDVTVVGSHVRPRPGIRVHRVKSLDACDARKVQGIPITAPARTLLDLAGQLNERGLELALHEAIATQRVTIRQVQLVLSRYPRRPGSAALTSLATGGQPLTATRSGGEETLHRLLRRSGLPPPEVNAKVGRWTVDFLWRREGLAVELDGVDFHSSRVRIERDHRKDLDLRKLHIDVMRFVGRQVTREPEMVLVTIAQALAGR